jgi:hypothetical protein
VKAFDDALGVTGLVMTKLDGTAKGGVIAAIAHTRGKAQPGAPIPLRFIGVVRTAQGNQLIAVLSDGTAIYRGSEGDIIEGRYKIVRVGLDSVELVYLDGRGQQVLWPSGS